MTARATAWRPRLVALDVDGCLLEWVPGTDKADERVTPAVRDAVRRVTRAGVPVVLASGRSAHGLADVAALLDLPRSRRDPLWFVASNGSLVARHPPLEVVHAATFDASRAIAAVRSRLPGAALAVEHADGYRLTAAFPRGLLSGASRVVGWHDLGAQAALRVVVRHPGGSADEVADAAGLAGTGYDVGGTGWLDLSPTGVSKASGLGLVAEALGVDAGDVLAIGDGRNDVTMLRWSGRGVAMGQASAEVRAAADAVTGAVGEDGVALELARWFGSAERARG